MINARLKLLVAGGILFVFVAVLVVGLAYQVLQKQLRYTDAVESLQTKAVDLNVITTDLLYDAHTHIQSSQWQMVFDNLAQEINRSPLYEQASYPFLKKQHLKIKQRFQAYLRVHAKCLQDGSRKMQSEPCQRLLHRLRTQIRIAQQDLLVEIYKIGERLSAQSKKQNVIGGLLLLALPVLMAGFIIALVLPITRSLRKGFDRIMVASERFSCGDFGFRVKAETQDEMGLLASTYNKMASRREAAEQQLQQTEKVLRQAQKMEAVGQLTGGIAHDFNNMLSVILGNLELLQRHIDSNEKTNKYIAAIQKSSMRATDLTRQLLGFSRRHSGQLSAIWLNVVIAEMDDLIARSITPQVEVVTHFADDLWLTNINSGDFQDALLNLVINARDAMNGRGRLTLETNNCVLDEAYCSLHPDVTAGKYVHLAVSDDGMGMAEGQLEHVFEPFFTTKEPGNGTGLGLAMVFGFISRSAGHIKVYSEPNIGTTFHVYLPKADDGAQEKSKEKIKKQLLPRGTEMLLVVDDEEALLELAEESLVIQGYRVVTAVDGKQALQKLKELPEIALLFSDVVMPGGINGYELAEQACQLNPEIKVLLTSGYTEKAIARNGQARFNTNLLSKPYSQAEMIQRVRILLDTTEVEK